MPEVPAAPAVPPVMTDALGSDGFSFFGVADTRVGNTEAWVSTWIRCCAEVAEPCCDAHSRRNSRFGFGAAAGLTNTKVTAWLARVRPSPPTVNSRIVIVLFLLLDEVAP